MHKGKGLYQEEDQISLKENEKMSWGKISYLRKDYWAGYKSSRQIVNWLRPATTCLGKDPGLGGGMHTS